jgi:hypothetical protein
VPGWRTLLGGLRPPAPGPAVPARGPSPRTPTAADAAWWLSVTCAGARSACPGARPGPHGGGTLVVAFGHLRQSPQCLPRGATPRTPTAGLRSPAPRPAVPTREASPRSRRAEDAGDGSGHPQPARSACPGGRAPDPHAADAGDGASGHPHQGLQRLSGGEPPDPTVVVAWVASAGCAKICGTCSGGVRGSLWRRLLGGGLRHLRQSPDHTLGPSPGLTWPDAGWRLSAGFAVISGMTLQSEVRLRLARMGRPCPAACRAGSMAGGNRGLDCAAGWNLGSRLRGWDGPEGRLGSGRWLPWAVTGRGRSSLTRCQPREGWWLGGLRGLPHWIAGPALCRFPCGCAVLIRRMSPGTSGRWGFWLVWPGVMAGTCEVFRVLAVGRRPRSLLVSEPGRN